MVASASFSEPRYLGTRSKDNASVRGSRSSSRPTHATRRTPKDKPCVALPQRILHAFRLAAASHGSSVGGSWLVAFGERYGSLVGS